MTMSVIPKPAVPNDAVGLILPLVLFFGTTAGLSASLAKLAVTSGVPPAGYALWVCLGAGIILLTVAMARGTRVILDRVRLRYGAVVGIVGVALPTVNTVTVLDHVPVGVAMLLAPLTPLLTYVFSQFAGLERF